ncbi:MAG: hypothetical protein ABH879_06330 [archaeon]
MTKDVPRGAVIVLLVLVILVAVLGTWTFLERAHSEQPQRARTDQDTGIVKIEILGHDEPPVNGEP